MSSFLSFRNIDNRGKEFFEGFKGNYCKPFPKEKRIPVRTADDIGRKIFLQIVEFQDEKKTYSSRVGWILRLPHHICRVQMPTRSVFEWRVSARGAAPG